MELRTYQTDLGGRSLSVETGRLARQANGAVLARYGDTTCLVTATASNKPREGIDFFPLRVDFEERLYAAGRIPGSFFRREGRPTESAILACRLTDRPLRPLFPEGFRNDVQIVVTVLSYDHDNLPELIGINGASLALGLSDIPFDGPLGAVMVGRVDGRLVINPNEAQRAVSDMQVVLAGTAEAVLMIEAEARQIPESEILDAVYFGHEAIRELCAWQSKIIDEIGLEKTELPVFAVPGEIRAAVEQNCAAEMAAVVRNADKAAREEAVEEVKSAAFEDLVAQFPEQDKFIKAALYDLEKKLIRRSVVEDRVRPDGRGPEDIRPIWSDAGLLPRAHGSGLFTRGQTQVLTVAALGAVGDRQMLDSLGHTEDFKRYMHHYNFPPYSVGEARPLFGPGRREIGHGALAERALIPVLPDEDEFPYTIRLVSEVLESNGSTSMGSVCGSSLALMDAGVPIKAPVGGVAMGLIKEDDQVVVLSDIQGVEDFLGDMDFKVAGTATGVTAIQLDTKIAGIDRPIMEQAMEQARRGRLHILARMSETLQEPRQNLSRLAPRIFIMHISPDRIRDVIGPGGKMINRIAAECRVKIDIDDTGKVFVAAEDEEGGNHARQWIDQLTRDVKAGEKFLGQVTRLMNFGAFVEMFPGKEGLVHISHLANERVPKVEDFVQVGDKISVKVIEIDDMGRINLSRKELVNEDGSAREQESLSGSMVAELDVEPSAVKPRPPRSDDDRGGRGGPRRDGNNRGGGGRREGAGRGGRRPRGRERA